MSASVFGCAFFVLGRAYACRHTARVRAYAAHTALGPDGVRVAYTLGYDYDGFQPSCMRAYACRHTALVCAYACRHTARVCAYAAHTARVPDGVRVAYTLGYDYDGFQPSCMRAYATHTALGPDGVRVAYTLG